MFRLSFALSVLMFSAFDVAGQNTRSNTASVSDALLARTQEWVATWNDKDVKRMRRLHADDVSAQLYGLGDKFQTMADLLKEAGETHFWDLTWSLKIEESHVRMLGANAAVVAVRLVGTEVAAGGPPHPVSGTITLVFQRIGREWLIVHVQDSSPPPKPDTP